MIPESPRPTASSPELFEPGPPEPGHAWRRALRLLAIAVAAVAIVGAGAALGLARYGGAYSEAPFAPRLELPDPASIKGDPAARAQKLAARLTYSPPSRRGSATRCSACTRARTASARCPSSGPSASSRRACATTTPSSRWPARPASTSPPGRCATCADPAP